PRPPLLRLAPRVARAAVLGLLAAALCLGAAPSEPAAAAPGAILGEKSLKDVMQGTEEERKKAAAGAEGAILAEKSLKDVMQGLKEKLKQLSAALEGKKQDPALDAVGEMQRLGQAV